MLKNILKILSVLFLCVCFIPSFALARQKNEPYRIVQDPDGVYIVEIVTNKKSKVQLLPYFAEGLKTNLEVYNETGAKLAVNTGFFDPHNKKTVSYVVSDGVLSLDPKDNENLMNNVALKEYHSKILNRSEFRILENELGEIKYDIAPHEEKPADGYKIKHSIQAGPMLFPDLRLEEEFFVLVKDGKIVSESASALHKYARTAIGIRENKVYLFIITNRAPMTLEEVADLTRRWGMEKSMAFDGGGSTSFDCEELHVISEKDNSARKLKSFLILK